MTFINKNPKNLKRDIVSFDMDQTLIDSNKCHIAAYKAMLKKMNIKKDVKDWHEIIRQKTRYEAVAVLCPEFDDKTIKIGVKHYMHFLNHQTYKLAKREKYVIQTLDKIKKNYEIAIVTNCREDNAEILLKKGAKIPLTYFDLIIGSDDVKHVKPSPEPILLAKKELDGRILAHIGDSINDIISAKKAHVKVISIATGNHPASELKKYKPDFILPNLKDVPKIIDKLERERR